MPALQFEYCKHTHVTVGRREGPGQRSPAGGTQGIRFLIRSRLFTGPKRKRNP